MKRAPLYVVLIASSSLAWSACSASFTPCAVRCGSPATSCPSSLVCASDGYCHESLNELSCASSPDGMNNNLDGNDNPTDGGADGPPPVDTILGFNAETSNITTNLFAVWGSSSSDVYAVGNKGVIIHSTGDGTWHSQSSPISTADDINGIWGSSKTDVYAVSGNGDVIHSTGDGTWQAQPSGSNAVFKGIWGSGANDIYVVGYSGMIMHSTGDGMWHPQAIDNQPDLYCVGGSAGSVYACGLNTIFHTTGDGAWTKTAAAGAFIAQGVWGFSNGAIFVDSEGNIERDKGNDMWSYEDTQGTFVTDLEGVWGQGSSFIYAVGGNYIIYSNGDGNWLTSRSVSPNTLRAIYGWPTGGAYAVGSAGAIYRGK